MPSLLRIPQHVAIIMDGNGRWAAARGLPRIEGHRAGTETVKRILNACQEFGVKYLTLYAFSTENWSRPRLEVTALMRLLREFLDAHRCDLREKQVRLNAIGDLDGLPYLVRRRLRDVMEESRNYRKGTLTLALNYGGRAELVRAARHLAVEVKAGRLEPKQISEELVARHLDTADMPDPDLIIRTSGELRLSNFLLWQASYAEFWVTQTHWPDFTRDEFYRALEEYSRRGRRFGGVENV